MSRRHDRMAEYLADKRKIIEAVAETVAEAKKEIASLDRTDPQKFTAELAALGVERSRGRSEALWLHRDWEEARRHVLGLDTALEGVLRTLSGLPRLVEEAKHANAFSPNQ